MQPGAAIERVGTGTRMVRVAHALGAVRER